jgi:lysozyme family protein
MRYAAKWPQYAKWWDAMTVRASRQKEFDALADKILAHKDRYQAIENRTGVPWYLIAVLHLRESSPTFKGEPAYNFNTYLGNGQSFHKRTTIVPKGRGPFASFEDGAVDALRIDGLSTVQDWRLEKILYYCEIFNGAGYDAKGLPSPYVWGGTNIQRPGKYVRDGVFSRTTMDPQPGCAPILRSLAFKNHIDFMRET